jgi:thiol-disulfide isomerase/thioredoxin
MTIRSLATSASVIALCLIGAASTGISGEVAHEPTGSFAVAAAQSTAPNFVGISNWFNSGPLSMASLRGKVVLVDFWTYGCVNCVNTLPYVTQLYAKYRDRGLVVVGVHTPEFPFERSASNVQAALKRHGITYPVAQDNDSQTWNAYSNQYWPSQYIVDQSGRVVFHHDGEGQYEQIDRTIARLLNVNSLSRPAQTGQSIVTVGMGTPTSRQ